MRVLVHEDSLLYPLEKEIIGNTSHPKALCCCKVCGGLYLADVWGLKSGAIKSCGCLRKLLPKKDITGVMTDAGNKVVGYVGNSFWRVQHQCGHTSDLRASAIFNRTTGLCNSCSKSKTCVDRNTSHKRSRSKTYKCWLLVRRRCYDPTNNRYSYYGGKGITVCDRWLNSFENFYEDMGECPEGMSIDRIDNSLNYSLDNCKWSTQIEQANNKTNNLLFTDGHTTWSLRRWCELFGKDYKHIWYLYRTCGISIDVLFDGKLSAVKAYN